MVGLVRLLALFLLVGEDAVLEAVLEEDLLLYEAARVVLGEFEVATPTPESDFKDY